MCVERGASSDAGRLGHEMRAGEEVVVADPPRVHHDPELGRGVLDRVEQSLVGAEARFVVADDEDRLESHVRPAEPRYL